MKISEWSTTPPLKITLFLWHQISLTIKIHTLPSTELKCFITLQNCVKWAKWSMGAADNTPNHAEHWPQTSQAILQSKSKWLVDSSFNLQKQQTKTSVVTSRRAKLTLVAILFSNTLHARTWVAGKALIL